MKILPACRFGGPKLGPKNGKKPRTTSAYPPSIHHHWWMLRREVQWEGGTSLWMWLVQCWLAVCPEQVMRARRLHWQVTWSRLANMLLRQAFASLHALALSLTGAQRTDSSSASKKNMLLRPVREDFFPFCGVEPHSSSRSSRLTGCHWALTRVSGTLFWNDRSLVGYLWVWAEDVLFGEVWKTFW